MSRNPNILLFMVDQLTAFVLSAYGGTVCKTPNLDKLARNGTVFEQAFCTYPLCAPSRCSLMSGRLPSRISAFDNGAEFPASVPTFTHYLRSAGYYTCISGKMHFVGPDQFHGFEERLTPEIYPADMSWTPDGDFRDITGGENEVRSFGVSTLDTVRDAAPVAHSMQIEYDEDVVHQARREIFALKRRQETRPFFMTVSLTQPHDPYVTKQKYWDLYQDEEIDDPRAAFIPLKDRDPHSQSLYYHYSQHKLALTDQDYRRARRGYYGMISHIDELFGHVIEALMQAGFGDNTVVVFTSDHGDMIGERGMWFKKTLFNPAIQVPLIVSLPDQKEQRVTHPVSLLDLFPTFLGLAGLDNDEIPTQLDGRSLLPALMGGTVSGPVFAEHIDGGTAAPRVSVRDKDKKIVLSEAYPPQFYDLSVDPLELNNLAGQGHPDEQRLTAIATSHWNLAELKQRVLRSQSERRVVDRALATGREERWDFETTGRLSEGNYVRRGDQFPDIERQGYIAINSRNK